MASLRPNADPEPAPQPGGSISQENATDTAELLAGFEGACRARPAEAVRYRVDLSEVVA